MDLKRLAEGPLRRVPRRVAGLAYRAARRLPPLRRRLDVEYRAAMDELASQVHRHRDAAPSFTALPERGLGRAAARDQAAALAAAEGPGWREGHASGAVYHGDSDHIGFANEVYALHSQANPLHVDIWPSAAKFEAEIVSMTAVMLGGGATTAEICGTVTSGGTESIILAMKAYRDRAGKRRPEVIVPETAHVAFDKAAALLGLRLVRTPVGPDFRADPGAVAAAMGRRTVAIVGSAPAFPHGIVDPIAELSELARLRGVGFHSDACLGGFVLPWAEQLGYPVPAFDFRLPGVTSMSADTHKYGYAPKGTSVVLYRGRELRRRQYFTAADWPGGLYASPTLAGSRPGGLSAAAWAVLVATGAGGYREAAGSILETAARIREGIEAIDGLEVLGDPLWVIAFRATEVDVYRVLEAMARRGWSLNGLQRPPAVHLAVTLTHTRPGVADRFLADLAASVSEAASAGPGTGVAAMYGTAASIPARGAVDDLLERYLDMLYDA